MFVQGYYLKNGLMNPRIYNAGIPSVILNGSTTSPTSTTVTPDDVEVIRIELREKTNLAVVAASQEGVLKKNGTMNINLTNIPPGDYYIIVNPSDPIGNQTHTSFVLATCSSGTISVSSSSTINYNFTTNKNQAFGDNLISSNDGASTVYLLINGDINNDGYMDFNDYPDFDLQKPDLDGNGYMNILDKLVIDYGNYLNFYSILP